MVSCPYNYTLYLQIEGKIIMARFLSTFSVHIDEGYQLKVIQRTTLTTADGVPCTLQLR